MKARTKIRLEEKLRCALNQVSAENDSDTPDFILAKYLLRCLDAYNEATKARKAWFQEPPKEE